MNYSAILDLYTLEDILEHNDVTPEEALEYLVVQGFLRLPEVQELNFE